MNVLISTGYFPEHPYADDVIALNIAKELNRRNIICCIAGLTYDFEAPEQVINDIRVFKIPYYEKDLMHAMKKVKDELPAEGISSKDKLRFAFRHPVNAMTLKLKKGKTTDYAAAIETIIGQEHIDCLISQVWDFDKTEELLKDSNITIPKIYYQLDPYGKSLYPQFQDGKDYVGKEIECMSHADAVVTTLELMKEYQADSRYKSVLSKMTALPFPSMTAFDRNQKGNSPLHGQKDEIKLLFTGTLEDNLRNPSKTFAFLEQMMQSDEHIHIYFTGRWDTKAGDAFLKEHGDDHFHKLGFVSEEELNAAMMDADILVNIGSRYWNMLPSKIFKYFETGKPILNFQPISNSEERCYFDRYPLAFTVDLEGKTSQAEQAVSFIHEVKGKSVPVETVRTLYEKNTPAYAAEVFAELIDQITVQRK